MVWDTTPVEGGGELEIYYMEDQDTGPTEMIGSSDEVWFHVASTSRAIRQSFWYGKAIMDGE
jgi:hypothetical protein